MNLNFGIIERVLRVVHFKRAHRKSLKVLTLNHLHFPLYHYFMVVPFQLT